MNKDLQTHIITLSKADQVLLEKLTKSGALLDYTNDVHPELKKVFEHNTAEAKKIIDQHGWPSISLIGSEGSDAFWYIVQHSVLDEAFMQSCVSLLEERVAQQEAQGWHLAFLSDRTRVQQGKLQIYGTQHDNDGHDNIVPCTIDQPERVDERRLALGLEPLRERTALLQKNYDEACEAKAKSKL